MTEVVIRLVQRMTELVIRLVQRMTDLELRSSATQRAYAFNPLIMDYVNSFIWRYHNQNVRGEEVITRLMNALDE